MRIAVISDLHIGAEEFVPDGFGEFLDHLEREHDEIVLLGDVFECYFPRLPWKALAEYDRFDHLYRDITRRFRSAQYTVLSGNHDMVAQRARGIPSRTERGGPGFRILLSHGHENESAYQSPLKIRLVELYMWLVYRLKRLGLRAPYDYSYRMDYELNVKDGGAAHVEAARAHVQRATTWWSSATRTASGTWSFAAAAPTSTPATASGAGSTPPSISTAGSATCSSSRDGACPPEREA